MMRCLISLVVFLLVVEVNTTHAKEVPLGIWSWNQDDLMTASARGELLEFCRSEGITHIDQHVSIRRSGEGHVLENANKLEKLVVEAGQRGISVSALRGDHKMFFAEQHDERIAKLKVLLQFNQTLPSGVSLQGIKYDVEPYLTVEWKEGGKRREQVMRDYIQCLIKIRRCLELHDSKLLFSADVPFWWDEEELSLSFDGVTSPFVQHIQDHTDSIAIMSYRRSAQDVLALVEQEFRYSGSRDRSVAVGLSFNSEVGEETVTTFAGHPVSTYRSTLAELRESLKDNTSARSIMLHDYKHLKRYLSQDKSR